MTQKILILVFSASSFVLSAQDLLRYVNPLIGTDKMGHTYPGATVPFGMVQLSPDTDTIPYEVNGKYNKDVYKYCAGYQYDDPTIVGFSHTHFSGTGHSDLGDILIMPTTGPLQMHPGTADAPETGFRSRYSHDREKALANYYTAWLDDHGILAELTTTERVGMHRYTFPQSEESHIILDLVSGIYNYENKNVWTFIRIENDTLITGYRQTSGWARTRTMYFAISFSKPFTSYGYENTATKEVYRGFWRKFDVFKNFPEIAGKQIRAHFDFATAAGEKVMIKVGLSSSGMEGAIKNLREEIPHWDFSQVVKDGQEKWNDELSKIRIETLDEETKTNFYTALYHTMLAPTLYSDVDGQYRGLNQANARALGYDEYTTFSLWDTYRAEHPLLNLLHPKRNGDMVVSMLNHYRMSTWKMLPVWSHHANENWCMIGYHSVPVIADAILNGNEVKQFENELLDACVNTARNRSYDGLGYYIDLGYVPEDKNGSSVSKTLEYAFDDWCIDQIALKLGKDDIYAEFIKRSENYKNVFDSSIGYMRPRLADGSFKKEFDVLSTHGQGFIEGNAWNYSLYVPHAPDSLIAMMGGKKRFTEHLDSLFTMNLPDSFFAETEDITREGIIGNYVHGNEPSHHAAYLFNYAGVPQKTQERVRMIMKKMYQARPDGLGGNDDCGQMSAWYIFSALGFYPVAPGSGEYVIGSPLVVSAALKLKNAAGKDTLLTIKAQNQSEKNVHVARVLFNGRPVKNRRIKHSELIEGGELVFVMSK
jgi:predicted alpha-1,2-mannosidase